jgi:hypothetical protein
MGLSKFRLRRYSQAVTATDSNFIDYLFLFEGAGSSPAGVAFVLPVFWEYPQLDVYQYKYWATTVRSADTYDYYEKSLTKSMDTL